MLEKAKISNPLFKLLKKLNFANLKDLRVASNYVRDSKKKNKVFYDKKNNFYFLQKSVYTKNSKFDQLFKDNQKNKNFYLKYNKKKLKTKIIDDERRRFNNFKNIIKNKSVLDFGAGYGEFLKQFNRDNIAAVEKRDKCINYLKKNKIKVFKDLSEINDKFDFITFFNSVDHLEFPDLILKKEKKLLNKNGRLIIEVPNSNNLLYLLNIKEYKDLSFCKKHLIIFSDKVLKKLLIYSGFKIEKLFYYQRYNLDNHLNWIINKRPNGHNELKNYSNKKSKMEYERLLIKKKFTDTIILIVKKNA